jgi:hypothetical protein
MQFLMDRNGGVMAALAAGYLLGSRTVITATGANTYTVPTGCRAIIAEVFGAGGGGGTTAASGAGQIALGSGGTGGGYAMSPVIAVNGGLTFNATVAAGAAAGLGAGVSIFSAKSPFTYASVQVGLGGTNLAAASTEGFVTSGASSIPAAGEISSFSTSGKTGLRVSGTVGLSGQGCPGPLGGAPANAKAQVGTAAAGGKYGAGGSGGFSINAGGASTGGAGGQGAIIVWEFY